MYNPYFYQVCNNITRNVNKNSQSMCIFTEICIESIMVKDSRRENIMYINLIEASSKFIYADVNK